MTQFDSKLIAQAKKTKGYLLKKSKGLFSSWKNRYFIVLEDSLCVFDDQTLQSGKKSIQFTQIISIIPSQNFDIEIKTKKRLQFLRAKSTADQDLWVASLHILRQNHTKSLKNTKKSIQSIQSIQKQLSQSFKKTQPESQKSKTNSSSKRTIHTQNITYLLRQKQLSKFLAIMNLDKLSSVTKQQKFISRIMFIEDRKYGFYFSLSSKSIYPVVDDELVKQDFIYPYQLNVLYFLPIDSYKNALQNKEKPTKLVELCKCNQILESTIINLSNIRLQVHCQKTVQIQVKHLSQVYINGLLECIKKLVQVGKEYWNPQGKLLKNIDLFLNKFMQNDQNQLVFYKMVQKQFQSALNINSKLLQDKHQVATYFLKVDSLISNLKNFVNACQIKSPPVSQIKQKFVKLYHKFAYNYLGQSWNMVYKQATDYELIVYSKKVFVYFQVISTTHSDLRVKEGCRTLLKIALRNFQNAINQLGNNFADVEEESLRILKKVEFESNQQSVCDSIFFSTFCTNFFSILSTQFRSLAQIPKSQEFAKMSWICMRNIFKTAFESLSMIAQNCKQRSSLISISNSLKFLKSKIIPELFSQLQKSLLCSHKKQKQQFMKEISYQMNMVQTFCVKKLFIITFSSIDRQLLKHEIKNMDFYKICSIVIQQIFRLEFILPEVREAMYQASFEQVCFFLYICVVKFDNRMLAKDQCVSMINQKMTAINQLFLSKVDPQKIMLLLKDLNLLKQFITCQINSIKSITRDLKRVFGSNFTQLNLKNLISLRVSSLKQKQCLFQECRQEIKSSFNSADEIESFQRESFFNGSCSRQRKSTLTESIQSYCEQFETGQLKYKSERTVLFGLSTSIKQAYLYKKKVIKNINTTYIKLYYRLRKGKLLQYDNQNSEDVLNSFLLSQLKKCYIQPQKNDCLYLQFEKQAMKFKALNYEEASQWIQRILEAMEEQKSLVAQHQTDDGVLFEDLSKKITLETKETNQTSYPNDKQKIKHKKYNSPDPLRNSPKKTQTVLPNAYKKGVTSSNFKPSKQVPKKDVQQSLKKRKNKQKGCGIGCNFL